jgi:hypothetical protein
MFRSYLYLSKSPKVQKVSAFGIRRRRIAICHSGAIGTENHHGLLSIEAGNFTNDRKRFPISQVKK